MKLSLRKSLLSCLLLVFAFSLSNCEKTNSPRQKALDQKELDYLRAELIRLSPQTNCDDATKWKFATLFNGACSDPEYIPYSNQVDEASFLKKVTAYNEKQKAFNAKWNVNVDCILIGRIPPKGVECVNGKPKLIY